MSLTGRVLRRRAEHLVSRLRKPLPAWLRARLVSSLQNLVAAAGGFFPWGSYVERFLRVGLRQGERLRQRTLTETETSHEMSPRGFPMTGGGGMSSVSYYSDKLKSNAPALAKLSMDTGRFYNVDNGQSVVSCAYGDQNYRTIAYGLHRSELAQYFQQILDNSGLTNSELETKSMSLYLKDFWMHVDIVNSTNVPVYIELLDIRPRQDLASSNLPDQYYYEGLEDINSGATTANTIMMTDPYMSRPFVTFFNVYKTTKVILAPGEYHSHRVHFAPNMLLNRARIEQIGAPTDPFPYFIERLSYFCMMRMHGAPVIATDETSTDFATYSACKVGVCWWSKVHFTFGMPVADDLYFTDNLTTPVVHAETVRPDGSVVAVDAADP